MADEGNLQKTHRLWKKINKCVICGSNLKFYPSKAKDARHPEGAMVCEQNHDRFVIEGGFDVAGGWHISFLLPPLGRRYSL